MPPKKSRDKVITKPKRVPKGAYILPPLLSCGEVLVDLFKHSWRIGEKIGQGGFGFIYTASKDDDLNKKDFVIKMEPKSNGPLFCETNFYKRIICDKTINQFISKHSLKYLSVPQFYKMGIHLTSSIECRFLVIPRLGSDLQSLFESSGRQFSLKGVAVLALRMIDALQFIHDNEYVHADIKAANILFGWHGNRVQWNRVYLVDFGLAFRYTVDGQHRPYKSDPSKAHDGTIEFTSRDAHNGAAPSRRGDLEILGYCLIQWLCKRLPWEKNLSDKDYVKNLKELFIENLPSSLMACFDRTKPPDSLVKYFKHVTSLKYEEEPKYDELRKLFRNLLSGSEEWTFDFSAPETPIKGQKRMSDGDGLLINDNFGTSPRIKKQRHPSSQSRQKSSNQNQNAIKPKPDTESLSPKTTQPKKLSTKSAKVAHPNPAENGVSDLSPTFYSTANKKRGRKPLMSASTKLNPIALSQADSAAAKSKHTKKVSTKVAMTSPLSLNSIKRSPRNHPSSRSIIPGLSKCNKPATIGSSVVARKTNKVYNTPSPSATRVTKNRSHVNGVDVAVQTIPMIKTRKKSHSKQ